MEFGSIAHSGPLAVAIVGGTLSVLAGAFVGAIASTWRRGSEMRSQQALFASVVANASDAIIVEAIDGTVLSWNAAATALFGYSAEEARGRRVVTLILPEDRADEDASLLARCVDGSPVPPFDAVRRRRDGSLLDVSITVAPVIGFRGRVVAVAETIRDISARKAVDQLLRSGMEELEREVARRTQALADTERDLRAVTDAMPSMIAYWDKHGINRFANQAHEKWYGLVPRSMTGRRLDECFEESALARIRPPFERALRGESVTYEMELPARGTEPPATLLVHNMPDLVDRETRGVYVLVHDITALKRSQAELAESRAFLEQAGAISGVGGFRIDLLSGSQVWTRQTFAIFEIEGEVAPSAEELDKLMQPAVASRLWAAIRAASDRGEGYDLEIPVRTARGRSIWVRTIGVVEFDEARPTRVVGAIQDITERKNAEEALRATSERFALAADAAGIGVWEWSPLTDTMRWDSMMYRLYGMERSLEPLPLTRWSERVHPDDRQRTRDEMTAALEGGSGLKSEFRIKLPSGEIRHLQTASKVHRDTEGRPIRMVGIDVDVTSRKAMESELADAAQRDKLTGLTNRPVFMKRLDAAILRLNRRTQPYFGVLFLDFDRFKLINDTLGHEAGDELLRQIAGRLRKVLRASDTLSVEDTGNVVSRFGGDEFLVLINDLKAPEHALRIAERLLDALAPPYQIEGSEVHSSASIGIVTSDQCHSSAEEVVRDADVAMYEAKRAGRACSVVFNEAMHARLTRHVNIENNLRRAIGSSELYLVYQPIIDLTTNRMVSAEALVRWNHPVLGEITPSEFIPIAEETGLIVTLGEWVQNTACEAMAHWRKTDPARAPATISVNLSRAELALGQRLLGQIKDVLRRYDLPAVCLQLEITEREIMRHPEASRALMVELREMGVKLAMDDFGTGTSSLSFLRNYPFDTIKIDRSFLQDLTCVSDVLAVIHATINLVENLGMASLAEGVEDAGQLAILQSLGCRYAQGYLFSRPVGVDQLLDTMRADPLPLAGVG